MSPLFDERYRDVPGSGSGTGSRNKGRIRFRPDPRKNCNRHRILNKTYLVIIFAISQKSSNIWNNFSVNTVPMNLINRGGIHVSSSKKLCYFEFLNTNLKKNFLKPFRIFSIHFLLDPVKRIRFWFRFPPEPDPTKILDPAHPYKGIRVINIKISLV